MIENNLNRKDKLHKDHVNDFVIEKWVADNVSNYEHIVTKKHYLYTLITINRNTHGSQQLSKAISHKFIPSNQARRTITGL